MDPIKPLLNSTFLVDSKSKFSITNFSITKMIRELGGSISFTLNGNVDYIVTTSSNYFSDLKLSQSILSTINSSKMKLISDQYFIDQSQLGMKTSIDSKYHLNSIIANDVVLNSIVNALSDDSLKNSAKDEEDPLKIIINPKYIPCVCYNPTEKQPHFPDDYLILKSNLLSNTFIGKSNSVNKFYYLELHQATDNNLKQYYRIYTQNGRTDEIKKAQIQHRYSYDLKETMSIYSSIYSQKIEDDSGYKEVSMDFIKIGSKKKLELMEQQSKQQSNTRSKVFNEETGEEIQDLDIFQGSYIDRNLGKFIEMIYKEASKCLIKSYSVNITENGIETQLGTLSLDQISQAQKVLKEINQILIKNSSNTGDDEEELRKLTSKYFQIVPSKISFKNKIVTSTIINSMENLIHHVELLDMMKDLTTSFNQQKSQYQSKNHLDMKYYALGTDIQFLHEASRDYQVCMHHFKQKQSHEKIKVISIFKIENQSNIGFEFTGDSIGNCQYLYHSTKLSNYVGILKRGLLIPDVVVAKGGKRYDFGFLGNGIYFNDEITNSSKHFSYQSSNGTRFVIMSLVALGQVQDYHKIQPNLSSPPHGFNSCRGIKTTTKQPSDFKENEYSIYSPNQIKLSFIIEFQ